MSIEHGQNTECENLKNLSLEIKNKLNDTLSKMRNHYDYIIKNQIKIIKLQRVKNPSALEMKFSNLYHDIIKKYNHLTLLYKTFS